MDDYLKELASEQAAFEAGIDTLNSSVSETTDKVSGVNDLASKIEILEDGILEQEN